MGPLGDRRLSPARICHPWPWDRFDVKTRDKSRVRLSRLLESVQGAGGKPGPYRERSRLSSTRLLLGDPTTSRTGYSRPNSSTIVRIRKAFQLAGRSAMEFIDHLWFTRSAPEMCTRVCALRLLSISRFTKCLSLRYIR